MRVLLPRCQVVARGCLLGLRGDLGLGAFRLTSEAHKFLQAQVLTLLLMLLFEVGLLLLLDHEFDAIVRRF